MSKKHKIEYIFIIASIIILSVSSIVDFFLLSNTIYHIDINASLALTTLLFKITSAGILTALSLVSWLRLKINDLKKKNCQLDALSSNVPGSVMSCSCDEDLMMYDYSESFTDLTGYSREEMAINFDNKFIKMVYPRDRENVIKIISENADAYEAEYRMLTKSGKMIWVFEKGRMIKEADGAKYYSVLVDVTDLKRNQREIEETKKELEISNERYKIVMEQSDSIIFEFDIRKKRIFFSGRFFDKFGYYVSDRDFPESFINDKLIHPDDEENFTIFYNKILDGVHFVNDEHRVLSVVNGNREYIWCNVKATTILDKNGNPIKAIGRLKDVTRRRNEQAKRIDVEHTDALTGLLNRETFETFMESAITESGSSTYAVMIIDIHKFKYYNDNMGYKCADKILSDFALKLEKMFKFTDVISRISGDVFAVFLKNPTEEIIMKKIDDINHALEDITPENTEAPLSCHIGMSLYPADANNAEKLYYCAEDALKSCKENKESNYSFYSEM